MGPIVIINPNSTESVTHGMDAAVERLRVPYGPTLCCVTLEEGPPGIETDEHVAAVVTPICDLIRARQDEASAFVIGCTVIRASGRRARPGPGPSSASPSPRC